MQVIGSQFTKTGTKGDFGWMIKRPEYADALFIFNDNEEQFRAFQQNPTPGTSGCAPGIGNAGIRPYQCANPPRAAGVPTGSRGAGYPQLTQAVRGVIDEAFDVVKERVASGLYQRIFYSATSDGQLGTGTFHVGDDVKRYIVAGLRALGNGA